MLSSTLALSVLLVSLAATWADPIEQKKGESYEKNYYKAYVTNGLKYYKYEQKKGYETEIPVTLYGFYENHKVEKLVSAKPGYSAWAKVVKGKYKGFFLDVYGEFIETAYADKVAALLKLADECGNKQYNLENIVYDYKTKNGLVEIGWTTSLLEVGKSPLLKEQKDY